MCGLVGVAGDMSMKTKDGFKDMLLINQLRGTDATGIFSVSGGNAVEVAKAVGTPEILRDTKSFDLAMAGLPKVLAGHCRAKTIGENSKMNAHPYDFENLVGMHNGTLRDYYSWEEYETKRTDSYALFAKLDANGLDDLMNDLSPESAYTLIWWDKVTDTLNFLRNEKRPLWFTWSQDKRRLYWASEPWFFGAASRQDELWDGKPDGEEEPKSPYWQLPINQLWSFSVNPRVPKGTNVFQLHPVKEVKAEGKKRQNFQYHPSYQGRTSTPSSAEGGEVANPFREAAKKVLDSLNDPVDDIGKKELPGLPQNKAVTHCQVVSTTTPTTPTKSENPSSNVLDLRPASMRGKSSSRKILSLPSKFSKVFQLKTNEEPSKDFEKSTPKTGSLVSLRKVGGIQYISCKKTNAEWTEQGFENQTGGICAFCKSPIGDLNEVAEFIGKGQFICTTCHSCEDPDVSVAC